MPSPLAALRRLVHPILRDENDLDAYVRRVTLGCVTAAVALDLVNNLVFFHSWTVVARSAAVTVVAAALIAWPLLRVMGTAHLALYRAKAALEDLNRRDPLTGLANRRAMIERADDLAATGMVVAVADLDRFKAINDRHGHLAGDAAIAAAGRIMADELSDVGLVCRVGGEEFALVAPPGDAGFVRRRVSAFVRRLSAAPLVHDGAEIPVTVSVGLAEGLPGQSFAEVYAAADRALYVAKASGRNTVCLDITLEAKLDPPLPPEEIVWSTDAALDAPGRAPEDRAA